MVKLVKMGDDLDQLLGEIERRFCGSVSVSGDVKKVEQLKGKQTKSMSSSKSKGPVCSDNEDLDDFIDKLLEEDREISPTKQAERSPKGAAVKPYSSLTGDRKCAPVFIGGSSAQRGIGTSTSHRSCDQLRCTSCDFSVATFEDSEWDPSCDYLFFRNNVPERWKLQGMLNSRQGFRSYCCQCSWTAVRELRELRELRDPLQWVCSGKHHL